MKEYGNLEDLDFHNADDIANGSKGIYRLYITKQHKYEYYLCEVIKNNYIGKCNHNFKLKVMEILNGNRKNVGDIISKNGKQLYRNYHELRKANKFCRYSKHKQKYCYCMMIGVI